MHDRERGNDDGGGGGGERSRPQRGGEAGTTRFGMEDGDNSDVPATGGPASDDEAAQRSG
jgi:hypothetical protein